MKEKDYINLLIKENEDYKELCKSHEETIILLKRESLKKDKKILKLEKNKNIIVNKSVTNKLDNTNNELENLRIKFEDLLNKYNAVVEENVELKNILDTLNNLCDSDKSDKC